MLGDEGEGLQVRADSEERMSYCRWSSDDFQCDVYVYADVYGGWTIHVASRRRDWVKACMTLPPPVPFSKENMTAWIERHHVMQKFLDDPRWDEDTFEGWVDVPAPHAGETYNLGSAGECADLLEEIRASGCNVPQYAIDELREEQGNE